MKNKDLMNGLIPLGMIFGGAIGVILGMFFDSISLGYSISLGAGIGLLLGTIVYGFYSQKK